MKKAIVATLVLVITASCSAQWGKGIKGNGDKVTIERTTGDYDAIGVSGWLDVEIVAAKEGQLTLPGESNLLEYIITEVRNGKLVIKTENNINLKPSDWKNGIRITVPVERINAISLSGSGDIVGKTTLKSETLDTAMSGSGDITLSGNTTDFSATISGSGDIKAFDLAADNVDATVSGSADIKVTANKMLKARVSGSGDITYRGNPEKIDTKTSGSGDISKD